MADLAQLISVLEEQERTLTLVRFDASIAFDVGTAIRSNYLSSSLADSGKGIVISVHLFTGHTLIACTVGDGPSVGPDNWDWVRRKSNTVKRFNTSSYLVGRKLVAKAKGSDLDYLGPEYAAHGGAFPINIAGLTTGPIGAIVVSGLTQEEDHRLVVEALEHVTAQITYQSG